MTKYFKITTKYVFIIFIILLACIALFFLFYHYSFLKKESDEIKSFLNLPVGFNADPDPDGWRPLFNGRTLEGWEITQFGPQGNIYIRDSSIILSFGDGCTGINWIEEFPSSDYEISLEAKRVDGNDFFCGLTFPVYDEYCTLIVGGWGGSLVGISCIDGHDASENFTRSYIKTENNKWYFLKVRVTKENIICYIDGNPVINVKTMGHRFSVRAEVDLSKPLGICSWMTTAAIRNVKFRSI